MDQAEHYITALNFPALAEELVDALDKAYPHHCVLRDETPEDAHRRAGKRELIDDLLVISKAVEAEALSKNRRRY